MTTLVKLRPLTADVRTELECPAQSRTEEARLVVLARIVLGLAGGGRPYQVADHHIPGTPTSARAVLVLSGVRKGR
jgi:hypothetical protein